MIILILLVSIYYFQFLLPSIYLLHDPERPLFLLLMDVDILCDYLFIEQNASHPPQLI